MIRRLIGLNVYVDMNATKLVSTEPCSTNAMIKPVLSAILQSVPIALSSVLLFGTQTTRLDPADLKFSMYLQFRGYLTVDGC
jgi:hypothetical protein